jgi:hypothetical protein
MDNSQSKNETNQETTVQTINENIKDCKCYRQADVLDHCSEESHLSSQDLTQAKINLVTRLRAPNANNQTIQTLKPIPQEIDSRIANTLIKMENNGLTAITVKHIEYALKEVRKGKWTKSLFISANCVEAMFELSSKRQ